MQEEKKLRTGEAVKRRSLAGACFAHILHDGFADQQYALLSLWQREFGLSYLGLAVVRALYNAAMGGFQVPISRMLSGVEYRNALVLASLIATMGFALTTTFGFPGLCVGLIVAGVGSSIQHPSASLLITQIYGRSAKGPLSIYNFAGDIGKGIFPVGLALLVSALPWRPAVLITACAGILISIAIIILVPSKTFTATNDDATEIPGGDDRGFALLMTIGAFDTATRSGYLLFLPFLIQAKGGEEAVTGIGIALISVGGVLGKACCGWLGQRLGVSRSVSLTELSTAALILATLMLPLEYILALLPFLGVTMNGTSSILYGTVPELVKKENIGRAFAVFYTSVIGSAALAPIVYGAIADHSSSRVGMMVTCVTAVLIVPMVIGLSSFLPERGRTK